MTGNGKSPAEAGPQLNLCDRENVAECIRATVSMMESGDANLLEWAQALRAVTAATLARIQAGAGDMLEELGESLEHDEPEEPPVEDAGENE